MGNVSISTNIERLQPPYKVIMHGNKIGVQIGIQNVTIIDNETQKIKNRNFPLVAVEKRDYTSSGETLFIDGNGEGRVWDNVETHKVSELFTLGSTITWEDFLSYIWLDEAREDDENAPLKTHLIFQKICDYKCKFILPSFGQHTIHLHSRKSDNKPHTIYSAENDTFALKVQWRDNLDKMVERIISNLHDYLHIISPNHKATMWTVKYETNEEQLRPLVEKLNANIQATSFKIIIVRTFELVAIPTYGDEKETQPSATPQQEDYSKSNIVFKESIGEKDIDMNLLREWLNENFVMHIQHQYDWLAPLLFFDYHQLLIIDDSKSWAKQMNKWFPSSKIKCTQEQLNCYRRGFFRSADYQFNKWIKDKHSIPFNYPKEEKQRKEGFDFIQKICSNWLESEFSLSNIFK